MLLTLKRMIRGSGRTIGLLGIDGTPECFTLEDEDRLARGEKKIYGVTAIPAGRYKVVLSHSDRLNRITPELLDVPGFVGVRIHPGNSPLDTEGCILPGQITSFDQIYNSKRAWDALMVKLSVAGNQGIEIEVA